MPKVGPTLRPNERCHRGSQALFVRSLCPQHRRSNAQGRADAPTERAMSSRFSGFVRSLALPAGWNRANAKVSASPDHALPSQGEADAGHGLAGRGRGEWLKPSSFSTPCPAAAQRTPCGSTAAGTATASARQSDGKGRPHVIAQSLNHPAAPAPAVLADLADALPCHASALASAQRPATAHSHSTALASAATPAG